MRRRTLAVLVLGVMVLSSLVTWVASTKIRSPGEIAARTAPPAASPILVPVEKRVLSTKIVARGTGHYGSPQNLSITPSVLKGGTRVVTRVPKVGARIAEGDVVFTVSGRPTFLFAGAEPTYRDLGPGMSGTDVRQLEKALRRLGLDAGTVDSSYDDATGRAVAALYHRHGFDPVIATAQQLVAAQPRESTLIKGAQGRGGTQFPADEVVFVSARELRVVKVAAKPGSRPPRAPVTVSGSSVTVDAALPVEQAGLVKAGAEVLIDEPALGIKAKGTVSSIAARPGTDGADGFHVSFQVAVPAPPPALVGASVRLTVPITSTRKSMLAVPVAALSLGPDGTPRVQRSVAGVIRAVRVEPGLSAEGYVAVASIGATLRVGDLVVVGFDAKGR